MQGAASLAAASDEPVYGGGREYWNERYQQPKYARHRDWYCDYSVLRRHASEVFAPHLPIPAPTAEQAVAVGSSLPRLLVVGCGNSTLSVGLYEDGYTDVVNIDISDVVIQQVMAEHGDRYPGMSYAVMDAANMEFGDESFGIVLDKGTLDAVCCSPDCFELVHRMCNEICRVLETGGKYISISYGPPYLRRPYLMKDQLKHKWQLEERKVTLTRDEQVKCLSVLEDDESGVFYVYICTKLDPAGLMQREEVFIQEQTNRVAERRSDKIDEKIDEESDQDSDDDSLSLETVDFFENPFYKK